jgi:hypothetical protein
MTLYVLVPTAVYDHGVIGVYETKEQARAAALEVWPKTDGHHAFFIYERELGESRFDVFTHAALRDKTVAPDSEPVFPEEVKQDPYFYGPDV